MSPVGRQFRLLPEHGDNVVDDDAVCMTSMRLAALTLALATASAGCGKNKQLTNGQVAVGVVTAAAVVGLIILLGTADCNELTDACD
jgi:hypothetical protein